MRQKIVSAVSIIYVIGCLVVLALGTMALVRNLNFSGVEFTVKNVLDKPIKLPANFRLEGKSPEELLALQTKILNPGDTFFVYREYCMNTDAAMDVELVRYLETTMLGGTIKMYAPLSKSFIILIPNQPCSESATSYTLPETAPLGDYTLKSYAMYKDYFGFTRIVNLEDLHFTVEKK